MQGDCLEKLPLISAETVNLAIVDSPYNIGYVYEAYNDSKPLLDYVAWCRQWAEQMYRSLTPDGTFWMFADDHAVSELDVMCKSLGFRKRAHICWTYTFGVNQAKNFSRSHTHLLYYVKGKDFTFNAAQVRVPSARETVYNDRRANSDGRLPDATWILRPQAVEHLWPEDMDTWHEVRVCGTYSERLDAPTQLPEQLAGRIIRLCSNVGDLVLDPMMGTGTIPAVARKLGRRYHGIELAERIYEIARQRIAKAEPGQPLDGKPK